MKNSNKANYRQAIIWSFLKALRTLFDSHVKDQSYTNYRHLIDNQLQFYKENRLFIRLGCCYKELNLIDCVGYWIWWMFIAKQAPSKWILHLHHLINLHHLLHHNSHNHNLLQLVEEELSFSFYFLRVIIQFLSHLIELYFFIIS